MATKLVKIYIFMAIALQFSLSHADFTRNYDVVSQTGLSETEYKNNYMLLIYDALTNSVPTHENTMRYLIPEISFNYSNDTGGSYQMAIKKIGFEIIKSTVYGLPLSKHNFALDRSKMAIDSLVQKGDELSFAFDIRNKRGRFHVVLLVDTKNSAMKSIQVFSGTNNDSAPVTAINYIPRSAIDKHSETEEALDFNSMDPQRFLAMAKVVPDMLFEYFLARLISKKSEPQGDIVDALTIDHIKFVNTKFDSGTELENFGNVHDQLNKDSYHLIYRSIITKDDFHNFLLKRSHTLVKVADNIGTLVIYKDENGSPVDEIIMVVKINIETGKILGLNTHAHPVLSIDDLPLSQNGDCNSHLIESSEAQ